LEKSEEMGGYHRKMTTALDREDSWRMGTAGGMDSTHNDRNANVSITIDDRANEQFRAKLKDKAQVRLSDHLDLVAKMLTTPDFISNYFKSQEGMTFTKVSFICFNYN
jgi:hypothetical protein